MSQVPKDLWKKINRENSNSCSKRNKSTQSEKCKVSKDVKEKIINTTMVSPQQTFTFTRENNQIQEIQQPKMRSFEIFDLSPSKEKLCLNQQKIKSKQKQENFKELQKLNIKKIASYNVVQLQSIGKKNNENIKIIKRIFKNFKVAGKNYQKLQQALFEIFSQYQQFIQQYNRQFHNNTSSSVQKLNPLSQQLNQQIKILNDQYLILRQKLQAGISSKSNQHQVILKQLIRLEDQNLILKRQNKNFEKEIIILKQEIQQKDKQINAGYKLVNQLEEIKENYQIKLVQLQKKLYEVKKQISVSSRSQQRRIITRKPQRLDMAPTKNNSEVQYKIFRRNKLGQINTSDNQQSFQQGQAKKSKANSIINRVKYHQKDQSSVEKVDDKNQKFNQKKQKMVKLASKLEKLKNLIKSQLAAGN